MTTPFTPFANATLTFTVASGTPTGTNPVTGAPTFTTTEVEVTASLREAKQQKQVIEGVDEGAIYLTGRAVDPTTLPAGANVSQFVPCNLTRDRVLTGKFYLEPTVPSRFDVEAHLGQKLSGWFIAEGGQ